MKPYYYRVDPDTLSGTDLDELLALGWYRMHQSVFTCSHIGLEESHRVHWLRYAVDEITDRPSHRRIRSRNRDFTVTIEDFTFIDLPHQELHQKYRAQIDFDGAWSIEECLFGESELPSVFNTKCISVYDQNRLIAAGYFDVGEKTAASILHFFDPDYSRFSLGKYLILITMDYLKANHYHYYYPGYLVQDVPKMNYKLFLGQALAQYFDPLTATWKYFVESILVNSPPQ